MLSQYTTLLADSLCGGSSRKLIAGWWYSILVLSLILAMMSFLVLGSRIIAEGFAAAWSGLMLVGLCIGGTMIMRRFHNSMAVGFFMGSIVAMSQMFFLLFLVYLGYKTDEHHNMAEAANGWQEMWMAMFAAVQSLLLGSFAAILAAHRSEILETPGPVLELDDMNGSKTEGQDPSRTSGRP